MWLFSSNKGPSGFSSSNTAEEVTHGIDATGLTAVVTGKEKSWDLLQAFQRQHRAGVRDKPSRYNIWTAYSQSKLANILHANELARHLKVDGVQVTANSLHPGAVATNIFRDTFLSGFVSTLGKLVFKNVQQGASTTCYIALHPNVKGVSGEYFKDNNISKSDSKAQDIELAKKLWDFSMKLIHNAWNMLL
ncbi:hypothetical protein MKX01_005095 [Papaver californicum]|nr:hypothetical protein MKX01_005095 [Papaver californicum]